MADNTREGEDPVDKARTAQRAATSSNGDKFIEGQVKITRADGWTSVDAIAIAAVNQYVEENSWHAVNVINAGNQMQQGIYRKDEEKAMGDFMRAETAAQYMDMLNKRNAMPTKEQRDTLANLQAAHEDNTQTLKQQTKDNFLMYSNGDKLGVYDIAKMLDMDLETVRDNATLRNTLAKEFSAYIDMPLYSVNRTSLDQDFLRLDKLTTEIKLAQESGLGQKLTYQLAGLNEKENVLMNKLDALDGSEDKVIHLRNDKGEMVEFDTKKLQPGVMRDLLNNLKAQGITSESMQLNQNDIQLKTTANVVVETDKGRGA